jgi:hypothetical protein
MGPELPSREDAGAFLQRRFGEIASFAGAPGADGAVVRFVQAGKTRQAVLVPYETRLERVEESGELTGEDEAAARQLAETLAALHREKVFEPEMYRKKLRRDLDDLLASLDELARHEELTEDESSEMAVKAARWWGRLRLHPGRLAPAWEGDFYGGIWACGPDVILGTGHPASGEPGRDVASACFLYIERALASLGRFDGPFRHLFLAFFGRYLEASGDTDLLRVLPFHIAARALRAANDIIAKADADPRKRRYIDLAWNCLEQDEFRVEDLPDLLR